MCQYGAHVCSLTMRHPVWGPFLLFVVALSSVLVVSLVGAAMSRVAEGVALSSRSLFTAQVVSITASGDLIVRNGHSRFLARMNALPGPLHPGDTIVIDGVFAMPQVKHNPYDFDEKSYFRFIKIMGAISDLRFLIVDHSTHERNFSSIRHHVRTKIKKRIFRLYPSPQIEALVNAMLLGDRSDLDNDLRVAFSRTGIVHILAISGLHVGLISLLTRFILGIVLRRIPLPVSIRKKLISTFVFLFLWIFVTIVGLSASVFRAAVMISIVLLGVVLNRKTPLFFLLGTSFFVVLLLNPLELTQIGFQLSFSAVGGIALGLKYRIGAWVAATPGSRVRNMVWISGCAAAGTAPLLAFYFGSLPLATIFFSPIAIPLASAALTLSAVSLIIPLFGIYIAMASAYLFDLLVWFAKTGSSLDWIPVWNGPIHSLPFVSLIPLLLLLIMRTGKSRAYYYLIIGLFVIFSALKTIPSRHLMQITFLDVGQGDALVIESPFGRSLIVDTGPGNRSAKVVYSHLLGRNLVKSPSILLSHSDSDHTGGLMALTQKIKFDKIYHAGWMDDSVPSAKVLKRGDMVDIDKSMRVYVLHPAVPGGKNNDSLVLLVRYGETTMLLTGDAETEAEQEILKHFQPMLKSNLLKVGHHGSKTSSSSSFLAIVRPDWAIISVGKNNFFGHPDSVVLSRLEKIQSHTHVSAWDFAARYESDGHAIRRVNNP